MQDIKITDWIAIYAALLSSFVFIRDYLQSRPSFKVQLTFGISDENDKGEMGVFLSIQNVSTHTIHISNVAALYPLGETPSTLTKLRFLLRNKRSPKGLGWVHSSLSNVDVEDRCPVSIEARKSHEIFIPQSALEQLLAGASRREIRIEVQDPLWNSTYSSALKIDWYDGGATVGA